MPLLTCKIAFQEKPKVINCLGYFLFVDTAVFMYDWTPTWNGEITQ